MNNPTERQPKNTPSQRVLDLKPGSTEADWHRHPNGASRLVVVGGLPALALAQDAASWLGERERSVAWTWLRG